MIRLLIVIQSFKPYSGAVNRLVDNLLKTNCFDSNFKVDILTLKCAVDDKECDTIDNTRIFRIPNEMDYPAKSLQRQLLRPESIIGLSRKTYRKVFVKEKKPFDWAIAKRICSFIKKQDKDYDIIMPISGRREIAYGCYLYAEKMKNNKVILYQVDPFSTNITFDHSVYTSNLLMEDKFYNTFSHIFTTSLIYDEIKTRHEKNNNIECINFPSIVFMNKESNTTGNNALIDANTNRIKCVYIGTLYKTIRSPQYTIDLFSKLNAKDIYLYLFGNNPKTLAQEIQREIECNQIVINGKISLEEAINVQQSADFLVNIGNACTNMVPSKIFEYIGIGKPIINICKNRNCPSIQALKNYPYCINLFEDDSILSDQTDMLRKFIYDNRGKIVERNIISKYYHDSLAETFADIFYERCLAVCKHQSTHIQQD